MTPSPIEGSDISDQKIDPITASVIQGALENIAIEMGYKLMRMSYSSIIRESEDFGAALIDMQNRQLTEESEALPRRWQRRQSRFSRPLSLLSGFLLRIFSCPTFWLRYASVHFSFDSYLVSRTFLNLSLKF